MSAEDVSTMHFRAFAKLGAFALGLVVVAVVGVYGCGVEEHVHSGVAPLDTANDLGPPIGTPVLPAG